MTNEEILAFIELSDRATHGPWLCMPDVYMYDSQVQGVFEGELGNVIIPSPRMLKNGLFIAASRTIAPKLAEEVLKLREQLNRDSLAVICADALKDNEKLRSDLAIAVEALESYKHRIPLNVVISEERAEFEMNFGLGMVAKEALKKIKGMG